MNEILMQMERGFEATMRGRSLRVVMPEAIAALRKVAPKEHATLIETLGIAIAKHDSQAQQGKYWIDIDERDLLRLLNQHPEEAKAFETRHGEGSESYQSLAASLKEGSS